MASRTLVVILALATVTAMLPAPADAARTHRALVDDETGTFAAGLFGSGEMLWPEAAPVHGPDHARVPFEVTPCHRKLSLGLDYQPEGAFVDVTVNGTGVEAGFPYRFRLTLESSNGTALQSKTIDEPDPSIGGPNIPFYEVETPGTYTILLELLEGAAVHWELRVRGFAVHEEPTCDLWLNEVELDPAGEDAGQEWVELYNEGDETVDVSGWTVRGVNATSDGVQIPDGTTVPAGGYTVVELPGQEHLADADETVELVAPGGGVLDASPALTDTRDDEGTHQRTPDGGPDWTFARGTPGGANPR